MKSTGLIFPKTDEYETLAGIILFHYENIPKINNRIDIDRICFRILDVSETRIELIHLHRDLETSISSNIISLIVYCYYYYLRSLNF